MWILNLNASYAVNLYSIQLFITLASQCIAMLVFRFDTCPFFNSHSTQKADMCPVCNESDKSVSSTVPRVIVERLENLNVLCPYCSDEVIRGRYNLHIANCPEVPFECKSALCSWKGKQSELSEHTNQCPFVVIQPLLVEMAQKINMQSQYIKQLESKVVALSAK